MAAIYHIRYSRDTLKIITHVVEDYALFDTPFMHTRFVSDVYRHGRYEHQKWRKRLDLEGSCKAGKLFPVRAHRLLIFSPIFSQYLRRL